MVAALRSFTVGGREFKTPLLIPSFSSRGFERVESFVQRFSEYWTGATLVSAYDMRYHNITQSALGFSELVFIDSGGYEKGLDNDLSTIADGKSVAKTKRWSESQQVSLLDKNWDFSSIPTVLVQYDNPNASPKPGLKDQVERARRLAEKFPDSCIDILLKPGTGFHLHNHSNYLDPEALVGAIESLHDFSIIGVTEKELGRTLNDKILTIAKMRRRLDQLSRKTPIHVFGSLDPISSALYFAAGADIFDGLTWLRYGYWKGSALYIRNASAHQNLYDVPEADVPARVGLMNLGELDRLKTQLKQFCAAQDTSVFGENESVLKGALEVLDAQMEADNGR